jgi:NADPH2:quinone reductase
MRTLRSHAPGGPETLVLDTLPDPVPGAGEVVIAVEAAALNYPDLLIIQDKYQIRPPRPFAPGSEVAGRIAAIGPGVDTLRPGDRVIGLVAWGGLADRVCLPADACVPMPDTLGFEEGAALLVTYGTSHYALWDRGQIKAGDTLLVLGASGGVGLAAVQLGRAWGATVIAATSSADKADIARSHGASECIIYPADIADREAAKAFTLAVRDACPGNVVDIVFDPVGGGYAEPAFRTLGWKGRHLVVGFTAGIASLPLNLTLLKGASITGVFYGDFARREPDLRARYLMEVMALHATGAIRPHIGLSVPIEQAAEGFRALDGRKSSGKIVITF